MSVVTCKKLFIVTWMLIYIQALNFVISIVLCVVKIKIMWSWIVSLCGTTWYR
jgi:hypothetical protein